MRPSHYTERDPSLPHQVVFTKPSGFGGHPFVSCNCRGKRLVGPRGVPDTGPIAYDPIGVAPDLERARMLYNNPANHRKPFTDKDFAKW